MLKTSKQASRLVTVKIRKVRSLKYRIIQFDGSGLDITLQEIKLVSKLWVNLFIINKELKNGYQCSEKKACQFSCQEDLFRLLLIE
jgi:hypothetical protein